MDTPIETWTVRIDADGSDLQREMAAAANSGRQFSRALSASFIGVAAQGKGLTETIKGLALSLSEITLKAAFKPLADLGGNFLQSLIGGGLGIGGGASGGLPVPFASGGVISSPISFPLQGGATGIAGERGAEAIMPLARGPDGRLGVRADGGGSRAVNVTFNISTPDSASFQRTETQIAAMLNRAVSRGQRNL